MRIDVYLPFLLPGLLAVVGPLIIRRLAPIAAVRALTAGALVTAIATGWALLLLAASLYDDIPVITDLAHDRHLVFPEPVPDHIGTAAIVLAGLVGWRCWRVHRRHADTSRQLTALTREQRRDTELIVADSPSAAAFTIPGPPGHILVTSALLRALPADEIRVLLAHERAHLRFGHHRYQRVIGYAAAVNPLLAPLRGTIAYLLERWADEHAAGAVNDRGTAATALARAALATGHTTPPAALAFTRLAVTDRVHALHRPAPPVSRPRLAVILALAAAPALSVLDATKDFVLLVTGTLTG